MAIGTVLSIVLPALLLVNVTYAQQAWDASSYPNPTTDGYQRCLMKSPSSVCDPDAVLTEQQRYRLNYELTQLEQRTRQLNGQDFCEKKGIVGAVALMKKVQGGSENAVKTIANDILRQWTLDSQCEKSLVVVVASEDRRVWIGRGSRVPVYAAELTEISGAQKELFRNGNYDQAVLNIIQAIWDKALSKQGPADDGGRSRGQPFTPGGGSSGGDGGRGPQRGGGKGFSIPWFWIAVVLFVVIPTLLCCCCIYCCCCRGKGGSARGHPDPEQGGSGVPRQGGGGGGNPLSGFLSGMGGAAALNGISSIFRGGRGGNMGGGGTAPPPYNPGYTPGQPQPQQPGRGLYPSVSKADEGGGTNW